MTRTLGPALTALDYRVLHHVPRDRAVRTRQILARLDFGVAPKLDPGEVRRILRGLAHLGYVTQAGGWWRRA